MCEKALKHVNDMHKLGYRAYMRCSSLESAQYLDAEQILRPKPGQKRSR